MSTQDVGSKTSGPKDSTPTADDSLLIQLEKSHGPVHWSDLQAHAERQALYLFEGDTALIDVAAAFASNRVDKVRAWQDSGVLRLPTTDELRGWKAHPTSRFDSVVVQPFVLVRKLAPQQ